MRMWGLLVFVLGCLPAPPKGPPAPADASAGDAGGAIALWVRDTAGATWPLGAAPRRPALVLHVPGGALGDPEPVMLVRGEVTAALRADLERAPLLVAHTPLLVPVNLSRSGDDVLVVPNAPLELGGLYAIVVAGWAKHADGRALDAIVTLPFQVASAGAGASLVATFPPDRASGLPTSLPRVVLAFDDDVSGEEDIVLEREDGEPVGAEVARVSCDDVGLATATCVLIAPASTLEPTTRYALVVGEGVRDRGGASVGPVVITFTTGAGAFPPTSFAAPTCAIDEIETGDACVLVQDDVARLRTAANNAVYGHVETVFGRATFFAPRGEVAVTLEGLSPDTDLALVLRAFDAAGASIERAIDVRTTGPLAPLFIAEVRHDPDGPEPAQEYVELASASDAPIDLSGFTLSDRPDTLGDVLPAGATLPPRARVLLVADGFVPDHPEDAPVPSGVVLIRVGSALASAGISNGGEALFLRDALGRRVSEVAAIPSAGEGRCIARISGTGRVPRANELVVLDATCSPGF